MTVRILAAAIESFIAMHLHRSILRTYFGVMIRHKKLNFYWIFFATSNKIETILSTCSILYGIITIADCIAVFFGSGFYEG